MNHLRIDEACELLLAAVHKGKSPDHRKFLEIAERWESHIELK